MENNLEMITVIPAAGRGTRMMPLTEYIPKCLVNIGGKPLLSHVMDSVYSFTDRYVVVVGYRAEDVVSIYGSSYRGKRIDYVYQEEQIGIAHSISLARDKLQDEPFIVILGDNVFNVDIESFMDKYEQGTLVAVEDIGDINKASRYGVCNMDGDRILNIVEKPDNPPSTIVSTGLYVFDRDILDCYDGIEPSGRGEYEITDLINEFIDRGNEVKGTEIVGGRVDVGYPEDIDRAEDLLGLVEA